MKLSVEEYRSVKSELNMRVNLMYTQNMGLITSTLAAWAIVGTILANAVQNNFLDNLVVIPIVLIFLTIPAVLAIPLSIKSGDNLTRVAQLAAYVRIFFELPAIVHPEKYSQNSETENKIYMYESAFKSLGHGKRLVFFNIEFGSIVGLSLLSVLIYTICLARFTSNLSSLLCVAIMGSALIIFLFFVLIVVLRNSSVKRNFSMVKEKIERHYFYMAEKFGVIEKGDVDIYQEKIKSE